MSKNKKTAVINKREEKLALQMKENLKKRKAQSRARKKIKNKDSVL